MPRTEWGELPEAVRATITDHTGPIATVTDAGAGAHCDLAAVIDTTGHDPVFVKGIRADHPAAWTVANQIHLGAHLPDTVTPPLRWDAETAGWLLAAFAYADGRQPDLAPGSPDLPTVAAMLRRLAETLSPPPAEPAGPLAWRWARLPGWRLLRDDPALAARLDDDTRNDLPRLVDIEAAVPDHLDGGTLAHTDPVPANILLTDDGPRLLDWALPGRAPAWADTAFVALRLIDAGHTPASAHEWASTVPAYAADPAALTILAVAVAGLWTYRAAHGGDPRQDDLATVARTWMRHHLAAGGHSLSEPASPPARRGRPSASACTPGARSPE